MVSSTGEMAADGETHDEGETRADRRRRMARNAARRRRADPARRDHENAQRRERRRADPAHRAKINAQTRATYHRRKLEKGAAMPTTTTAEDVMQGIAGYVNGDRSAADAEHAAAVLGALDRIASALETLAVAWAAADPEWAEE